MKQARKKGGFLFIIITIIEAVILMPATAEKILLSLPNLTEQPYSSQLHAAQNEAKAQGFDLQVPNGEGKTTNQFKGLVEAVSQGVDGIIISPYDVNAFAPVLDKAIAAGIPVVTVGKNVNGTKSPIPHIGVDYTTGGVKIAEYITQKFPNGASILFLTGEPGNSAAFDLANGLKNALKPGNKYTILAQKSGNSTSDDGRRLMQDFLASVGKPPDVILAANDNLARGAHSALQQSHVPKGKVTLIGFEGSKDFDKIEDGTLSATVNLLPKKAVQTALVELLKNVRTGAPLESLQLQPFLVDSSNLESAKLADSIALPVQASPSPAPTSPAPTPSVAPSPSVNDPRQVTLLYVTNRIRKADGEATAEVPQFSSERSQDLTFGSAVVRVPENHQHGDVERPKEKWFLCFDLGKEKESVRDHFVLLNLRVFNKEGFLQFIHDSQTSTALLFVHGFNTKFEDALYRLAQITFDTQFKGLPIAFSWPSKEELTLTAYNHDRESAEYSADGLLQTLRLLKTNAHVSQIYIIAHSMGNQIVVNAIDKASQGAERPSLAEIVLAEPDVDWDYFSHLGHLLTDVAKGVTLYASATDTALLASIKWNGETKPRAGFIYKAGPLVLPGIETIDVTALGPDIFSLTFNHDVPMRVPSVLGDISRLLTDGKHPPNLRSTEIRGVPEGSSTPRYWKYPD